MQARDRTHCVARADFRCRGLPTSTASTPLPTGPDDAGRVAAVITFYRNGFTVNDGELRKMDDPANKAFLEDINNGCAAGRA